MTIHDQILPKEAFEFREPTSSLQFARLDPHHDLPPVIVKDKYIKVPRSFTNTYLSGDMKYHICFREPLGAEPYAKCLYVPDIN